MKTKLKLTAFGLMLSAISLQPSTLFAQGSLTPPGAPAPLMKSLDQIEARTPISTNGTVITVGGSYYLTGNLTDSSASADCLTIAADNVTLDLNGFTLSNTAGSGTQATGITIAVSRKNITIRNGAIQGFYQGIYSGSAEAVWIENMRLVFNYYRGICISGVSVNVRNNQVHGTGGTAVGSNQSVYGINVAGSPCDVENNTVDTTAATGTGSSCGIYLSNGIDVWAVNNRVSNAYTGIRMNSGGNNQYRDNLTSSCTTPYSGGVDRGNNF